VLVSKIGGTHRCARTLRCQVDSTRFTRGSMATLLQMCILGYVSTCSPVGKLTAYVDEPRAWFYRDLHPG
jgi:hypothetical protein